MTVVETAEAVRAGATSAREIAEAAIARADLVDPVVRSLVWRDDAATLRHADELDAARSRGERLAPFAGVPITIKDTFAVAGQPRTTGSLAIAETPQGETDLLPQAARRAGLVQLGRSASPELAMTTSCESPRYGVTHNPWDLAYSPGGSSGGSAAAVAAGIVPAALASDGGGSLRIPAAFCGLVGLKPGRGLLPQAIQGWEGGASEGVLTRTVRDTAALMQVLAEPDPLAWTATHTRAPDYLADLASPVRPLRIGIQIESFDPAIEVDPACVAAVQEVAEALVADGHEVRPLRVDGSAVMDLYPSAVIPAWLLQTPLDHPEQLQDYLHRVRAVAATQSAADYVEGARALRRHARLILAALFADVDLVLTPTTATRVPLVGTVLEELRRDAPSRRSTVFERTLAFTTVPSVLGLPALSLPTHLDDAGLPLGTQLIGPQRSEGLLLRLGLSCETRWGWGARAAPHAGIGTHAADHVPSDSSHHASEGSAP